MKRLLLALALAIATPLPVYAAASYVGAVRYDDAKRTFTIETTGTPLVQTKRLINPDRLVIDVRDAALAVNAQQGQAVTSRRIRGFSVSQVAGNPEIVRVVVELQPKVEPLIAVRQSPGRITITLEQPPVPKGERELETLPPMADNLRLPEPESIVLPSATPAPGKQAGGAQASDLPAPSAPTGEVIKVAAPPPVERPIVPVVRTEKPAPSPSPSWQRPTLEPITVEPPEEEEAPAEKVEWGFGSTVMLRWQQLEALDDYGASTGPVFAYPAGINGVELRHWVTPWVGFGLDSRLLTYDMAAEGVSLNRTDLMLLPALVARYPLLDGRIEPTLHLGYMARQITAYSHTLGATLPFSPTQFHHGYALGLGGRFRLLPALSLQLDYLLLPSVNGNLFQGFGNVFPLSQSRYTAELMLDVGPGYLSMGYTGDAARGSAYSQFLNGILIGAGWNY
ncbi:AMIN domain-containing protein [bacterium]|nr:AMIN domain-containing protein [bacterium]